MAAIVFSCSIILIFACVHVFINCAWEMTYFFFTFYRFPTLYWVPRNYKSSPKKYEVSILYNRIKLAQCLKHFYLGIKSVLRLKREKSVIYFFKNKKSFVYNFSSLRFHVIRVPNFQFFFLSLDFNLNFFFKFPFICLQHSFLLKDLIACHNFIESL